MQNCNISYKPMVNLIITDGFAKLLPCLSGPMTFIRLCKNSSPTSKTIPFVRTKSYERNRSIWAIPLLFSSVCTFQVVVEIKELQSRFFQRHFKADFRTLTQFDTMFCYFRGQRLSRISPHFAKVNAW